MTRPKRNGGQRFQKHPRMTLVAVVFIGCIAIVAVAEIAARIFIADWAPRSEERVKYWRYDELLGWEHKPGKRGKFNHRDFSILININSEGLRDGEYSLDRNDKNRMLILGDSFGWGFGVEHRERFSEILEKDHDDWEIINGSVSGYGTDQQFLYLKTRGILYDPDVILLLFHDSDFANNLNAADYWYNKPHFVYDGESLQLQNTPVTKATTKQKLTRFLLGRTYLGKVIYSAGRQLRYAFFRSSSKRFDREIIPDSPEILQAGNHVTRHLIAAINELSKHHGSKFIMISVPMGTDGREYLQAISDEEDIRYLPLDPFYENAETEMTFPHDGHWNPEGHKKAAEAIDEFLRDLTVF